MQCTQICGVLIYFGTLAFLKGLGYLKHLIIVKAPTSTINFLNLLGCYFVIEFQRLHTGPLQEFNNNKNI